MKTYKPRTYGILVKTFGLRGQSYLTVSTLVYFDLQQEGVLCKEQELWSTLPGQLGADTPLDQGFPKPHGEVLVTGSCFAPHGQTTPAGEVAVRVGSLEKHLTVFGDRHWRNNGLISEPSHFSEMPIDWRHAFGGADFKENPLGKGIAQAILPDGRQRVTLPNIEIPDRLIGSLQDRPTPAGLGALDLQWPQRMTKSGSYDKQWLDNRWPWFPDDLDPEFFNTTPADQFIDGFFAGDETIEIRNMHPDLRTIRSRLPGQRPRCFVTRKKSLRQDAETEFVEVQQKIDTVWLFPTIQRGLAVYRGTIPVLDDEYADIDRIFVAAERMIDPPQPPEYYLEEQKKLWNRAVEMDMAPLEKANTKISDMLKKMRQLPKQFEAAKLKATGKAPRMHRSPGEIVEGAKKTISESMANLDKQEILARDMHAKYGHMVPIDLTMFDRMRTKFSHMGGKFDQILAKTAGAQASGDKVKADVGAMLKAKLTPEQLQQAGIDPDNLLPPKKVNPWHDRGFPLVIQWRKNLEKDAAARKRLHDIGIADHTIKRAWLGLTPQPITEAAADWGMPPAALSIPSGLVMPRFHEATLTSVRVRATVWTAGSKDYLVPQSQAQPLFLPSVDDGAPVIRVADELEAWLVEQEIGDCCSVLAMATVEDKPDKAATEALTAAPAVVVVVPDAGNGTPEDWLHWQQSIPKGTPAVLPIGKTIFDVYKEEGLRNWLMSFLPDDVAEANKVDLTLPEKGKHAKGSPVAGLAIPVFDVKSMVKNFSDALKTAQQPMIDKINAVKGQMEATAREAMMKAGKDPALMALQPAKKSFAETGKAISDRILVQRDAMKAGGMLSAENEAKMTDAAGQAQHMGQDAETRFKEGMQKLAAAREKVAKVKAGELPDELKQKFAATGVDPDRLKKLTREEVIARHERGMTLAGANLNGVDLSGLDLRGIDLSSAQCMKTVFANCRLQGLKMDQTLALEADFSATDLRDAVIDKSILNRAVFKNADLSRAQVIQSMLKEADISGVVCQGTRFFMSVLIKANMAGADLKNADCDMSVFSGADASDAVFSGARLHKCLFKRTVLDRVDFSGAAFPSTMLHGATGENVCFAGADMTKGRIAGGTRLSGADFTGITMKQGAFRDSTLSGANFDGADLEGSIIENCDLSQANFAGVSAKKTRFTKSNLEAADMSRINLFLGSLKKARLVNTDLSGANLFGVDLFKSIVGETNFDGANLKRTLLHKRTEYIT
ncbi:MAG: DUF2169 domain-containing protein [Pseudomonadota bacterium]